MNLSERKLLSNNGVYNFFKTKKMQRFKNITFIDKDNFDKYIKPLNRNGNQYGWYVYINKCKADFGGVHIKLDDSKKMALDFLNELAKHLDAGNPLEPLATTL